jgi:hypothetical protein
MVTATKRQHMASIKKRPDGRWRARYRDDHDREHSKHFDRKVDGEKWLAAQTTATGWARRPPAEQDHGPVVLRRLAEPTGLGVGHPHRDGSCPALVRARQVPVRPRRTLPRRAIGQTDGRPPARRRNDQDRYNNVRSIFRAARIVNLPDEFVAILAHHIDTYTDKRAVARWLFQGEPGYPPHQNTVGNWWRVTQKNAGLTGIRLHDLRHFYASGLIAAGCDVVTVHRALGHAAATTTLRT